MVTVVSGKYLYQRGDDVMGSLALMGGERELQANPKNDELAFSPQGSLLSCSVWLLCMFIRYLFTVYYDTNCKMNFMQAWTLDRLDMKSGEGSGNHS